MLRASSANVKMDRLTIVDEIEIQKQYYERTAAQYDDMHLSKTDEQYFALSYLIGSINFHEIRSVLDIGSGTGRVLRELKRNHPGLRVVGIEPVQALREIGYANGLAETELVAGDGNALQFESKEFDLVCAFGVLHHIRHPEITVSEMLRVAGKAIFISDANNFGQGSLLSRTIKQAVDYCGLWPLANLIKTKGKGYSVTEGDGVAYSYSLFNNYRLIRSACKSVHILNTLDAGINPYRTAPHIALLGIKKDDDH